MRTNKNFMKPKKIQPLRCRYCKSTKVEWHQSDIWADTEQGWQLYDATTKELHNCYAKKGI